ncbi:MAG: acyl-CoA dehydrogenase family protein [Paracoccaceae bacterium]|nr:acyl-CoA dehydrogenase family protein [Paracoccaceae bacterium]
MTYRAPAANIEFTLSHVIGADRLTETGKYGEATADLRMAILTEAGKMAEDVLAPLQRTGDLEGAKLENGVVRASPGYDQGYKAIREGGWVALSAPEEFGGMGLPMILTTAVNEMMSSSCLSLSLNPLMTQGQIDALEHHASDEIKATYLPKLIEGSWTGTMNLTEPQAGSDVGALRSKAEPNDDGSYSVSGQKIYISWGDHDLAENICHLVLARLPDAPAGTKGVSLFIVPKLIPDENGEPGVANSLKPISLEHKLGLHGSPTCVMQFDDAKGWMVGPENGGMACMFTMMNNARLGVGVEGLGVAEAATQKAVAYAMDRKQGRTPLGDKGTGAIIDHADVRRMLMTMKALTSSSRSIALDTAFSIDMSKATEDAAWAARAAFLTPICKAFSTDIGNEVAHLGVQVHGGMGFVEETGAAQFSRDVRVTAIYEGTNGIQAMDLVGRKLMDGGEAGKALLGEIEANAFAAANDALGVKVSAAATQVAKATDWMLGTDTLNDRFAGAVPYLRAWGLLLGGHYLLKAAEADAAHLPLARFYISQLMPQIPALLAAATAGAEQLYALDAEVLSA